MKNKFPNSSMLTLITQNDHNEEKLLFIYLKILPDIYPDDKIHWYDGVGKDGKPRNVWQKLSIRQWVAIGKDQIISDLFESILSKKVFEINKITFQLSIPEFKLNIIDKTRDGERFDTLETANSTFILQEFYQKENLQFLSGYKTGSSEIKPLFPIGFFEENFIYNNLKKGIWGIKEYRTAYLTFHGVRKTSINKIGIKEMVGFYQQNFDVNTNYTAIVTDEAQKEIGGEIIDKNTGLFKLTLNEATQKGKVQVLIDNEEEKAVEYVLIQDIQLSFNEANKTFKDNYNRTFLINSNKEDRPDNISNFTWQKNVYVNTEEANKSLSDKFKLIFDYLGFKILIADPYFINNTKRDETTNRFLLSDCQIAFINALSHSSIDNEINQFNVLGCSRVTNQLVSDKCSESTNKSGESTKIDLMFQNYENLFSQLRADNNKLPWCKILFRKAKVDFHNRYWFSIIDINGVEVLDKCVIMTNSIGNMSELDIIPIQDKSQLNQIVMRYTNIFKNSELMLEI